MRLFEHPDFEQAIILKLMVIAIHQTQAGGLWRPDCRDGVATIDGRLRPRLR